MDNYAIHYFFIQFPPTRIRLNLSKVSCNSLERPVRNMSTTVDVDNCPGLSSPFEDDLSSRLDLIISIHNHLHTDKKKLRFDVLWDKGRPGDSNRPRTYQLGDVLPQARFWATLLSLDIDRLRALHDETLNDRGYLFGFFLGAIPEFVWWCESDHLPFPCMVRANCYHLVIRVPLEHSENTVDIRDGNRCCITGQNDAQQCHIIPLWTSIRRERTKFLLSELYDIFGYETVTRIQWAIDRELRKPSLMNTFCLSRRLQAIWQSGAFVLEPVGYVTRPKKTKEDGDALCQSSSRGPGSFMAAAFRSMSRFTKIGNSPETTTSSEGTDQVNGQESKLEYALARGLIDDWSQGQTDADPNEYGLQLRFQWLPATSLHHLRADGPDLRTDPRTIFQPLKERDQEFGGHNAGQIKDGQIFTVWADNIKDLPNWDFLQLRSLACRIHRLGGGADPSLYEPPRPDPDGIFEVTELHRKLEEKCKLEKRLAKLYKELGGDKDVLGMDPTKCHFCGADSDPGSR